MKRISLLPVFGFCAALALSMPAQAQLQLPRPSPAASVTQTVGLTDITIEYGSPAVKGRDIWGGLVPMNQIWRTGANAATKISFSKDVIIDGKPVPKGKYSVFTIPGTGEFTVILNKDAEASVDSYKMESDQLRFKVNTQPSTHRERLTFMFSDFTDNKTNIDMEWEKIRISFVVNLETEKQALDNIDKSVSGTWRTYNNAARYHLDNNTDLEKGMKYVDQSIALKEDWYNCWTKAQLFGAMNNKTEAYRWALKSKTLGDQNPDGFWYKNDVEKALVNWKPAAGKSGSK
jgi:hypothetical protein